jgi:CHAD domain-containing protein
MALDQDKLEKPFRKLRKIVKELPDEPSPEDVHGLRTRIRRIEAVMQALKLDGTREGKRLLKSVASIRKRAGQVRDMDVLTSFASTLDSDSNECHVQLLEHLGVQRFRAAHKLHGTIADEQKDARTRLKGYSTFITKSFRRSKVELSQREWSADAMAVALRLSSELAEWPPLRRNNLHPFRLKVKELRYTLQMANGRDSVLVSTLGEVKDAIGEWHDWTELAAIATETLDHRPACDLIRQIRSRVDKKLERALSLAVRMRRKYFGASNKTKSNRRPRTPRMKEAAISSAARLAA